MSARGWRELRSCTSPLRIIPIARKPGKMPLSHHTLEGAMLHWLVEAAEQLRVFSASFCMMSTCASCNSMSCMPYSVRSKPVRLARTRRSRVWSARPPGCGRRWRPSLTDHVWTLKEVLLYRVPPWPQPRWCKKWRRFMIVEVSGGRALRCQPRGLEEGLKTCCKCG